MVRSEEMINDRLRNASLAKCDCTLTKSKKKSERSEPSLFQHPIHTHTHTHKMQNNQDQDEIDYEVGQEQLDAVDRMLEELDMDEEFDRGNVFFFFFCHPPFPSLLLRVNT